eukprot:647200-Alexandrium_andersonii.AAC.1
MGRKGQKPPWRCGCGTSNWATSLHCRYCGAPRDAQSVLPPPPPVQRGRRARTPVQQRASRQQSVQSVVCLLYTSDAADDM